MRHDRRILDALEARQLAVARRTAESTVPKVQSLLLMVAWVETPGGGLRGRTGNWDAACVRGKILRLLSFTGVLCGQQARTQRVSAQRITSHVCTIKLSACACVHNWIKRVKQGPSLGPRSPSGPHGTCPPPPRSVDERTRRRESETARSADGSPLFRLWFCGAGRGVERAATLDMAARCEPGGCCAAGTSRRSSSSV